MVYFFLGLLFPRKNIYVNGECCIYAASHYCYLCFVPLMMKRRQIRERFGIKGSSCNDCMMACFCPCCLLVQQEKELEAQCLLLESGYQAPKGMEYAGLNATAPKAMEHAELSSTIPAGMETAELSAT
ncbi:hypothetical protein N7490_009989 [Penicillium lividum]|nr:hypothetical protein N7490_009989 [Penicillium lividum]